MEKKIWNNSMLMEEAYDRASKQLQEMFPDKELVYEDHDGMTRYKEYYQDIFDGMYDDIMNKLPQEISKIENNWLELEYEEDIDIHYRIIDEEKNVFEVSDGEVLHKIDVNAMSLGEAEFFLKEMGYILYYKEIYLSPFMIAICKFNYLKELEEDVSRD